MRKLYHKSRGMQQLFDGCPRRDPRAAALRVLYILPSIMSGRKGIAQLLKNNREWAASVSARDPGFFPSLSRQQRPSYLWIGCSDSRVPANEIVGLRPGELFVHRNVANIVVHTDLNCLSVIQYAVDVLKVDHVIVCGHYGCGGVGAAHANHTLGLIDNWLRHIQDVEQKHGALLAALADDESRVRCLCELNVIEQVINVAQTTVVRQAWKRGQQLAVHGWIYALQDGLVRDLRVDATGIRGVAGAYRRALANLYLEWK
jgi:carbonic anhydrase